MKVRVLGCSGGIGGRHLRTTSMLVDHDILIDAGTGVGELSLDELERIDHVFITHSHLDHIAALPLLIDTVADRLSQKLKRAYRTVAEIDQLRAEQGDWSFRKTLGLHAANVIATAKDLVKVDGDQIHLG